MAFPGFPREKIRIPAVLIAGIICLVLSKSGFLVVFFLVPLGFVCFRINGETSWAACAFASLLNLILDLGSMAVLKVPAALVIPNIVFFTGMTAIFTWINAPRLIIIPGVWRLITGSALMAVIFLLIFQQRLGDEFIYEDLKRQITEINSLYQSASSDVVQRELFDSITPEFMIETVKALMFRGGALVSMVFMVWMSRQAGGMLTRFTSGRARGNSGNTPVYRPRFLRNFYTEPRLIWFFSASLVLILIFRFFGSGGTGSFSVPLEILLWNVLVLCAILYLAQGLGILQYFASRLTVPPFLRFLLTVIFVILLFSPGVNAVLLGLVILLGIAENWISFRNSIPQQSGTNGPPSTPRV